MFKKTEGYVQKNNPFQVVKLQKEENHFALDLRVGLAKEVKRLVDVGNVKTIIMADKKKLKKIIGELKKASRTHASQADRIKSMLKKTSPALAKISASCKAQAKKKFKVWPSAYASGWGVRCTRGDFKKK